VRITIFKFLSPVCVHGAYHMICSVRRHCARSISPCINTCSLDHFSCPLSVLCCICLLYTQVVPGISWMEFNELATEPSRPFCNSLTMEPSKFPPPNPWLSVLSNFRVKNFATFALNLAENSAAIYVVYTYIHNRRKVNDVCHVYPEPTPMTRGNELKHQVPMFFGRAVNSQ